MHIPESVVCYWLESAEYRDGGVSMDEIATSYFGRPYRGQQTENCQPSGIARYDMTTTESCLNWENKEQIEEWLSKHPSDYEHDFELLRQAPGIGCVLAHLVLNEQLPYGEYVINIDS